MAKIKGVAVSSEGHSLILVTIGLALIVIFALLMIPMTQANRVLSISAVLLLEFVFVLSRVRDQWFPVMLSVPSVFTLLGLTVVPIVFLVWTSIHNVTIINFDAKWPFVGMANYRYFFKDDPLFMRALVRSLQFFFFGLIFQLSLGMAIAVLLDRKFPFRTVFSTIMLLPIMTNSIVIGILWKFMLNFDRGFVNLFLMKLGIASQPWLTNQTFPFLEKFPVLGQWLANNLNFNYAFFTIIFVNTWQSTPMVYLLFSAGLAALPPEPFEAAKIDGASGWQRFRFLTLPMMKPVIKIVLTVRGIDILKTFGVIWALFGNASITTTLNIHIHTVGLSTHNYGRSSALSLIVAGITFILYFLMNKLLPDGDRV